MKFTAAGDAIIQRRIQKDFEGFAELRPLIMQGDARFFNLETTLNYEGECYASQFSGGTYIRTDPECLDDLAEFGFNMTSFNNNHALDFSYGGFERTLECVQASGLVHAGCGMNLDEASAPRYLETPNGRVTLIAVNTTFNPAMMAGLQGRRVAGRPGINGMRLKQTIRVSPEDLESVKVLARNCGVNVGREVIRKEGYLPPLPDGVAEFGELTFAVGERPGIEYNVLTADLDRVKKAIFEAQLQADYIMISVHSHEIDGARKEDVPSFLRDFAHACIDAGANAVVGHGPHLLRPVEVYRDCPIFYSLGDFVLQLYNIAFAPEDFFQKYGLNSDATVHELLKTRSNSFTRGLMEERRMFISVIPYWEAEGGKLTKLRLIPAEAAMKGHKSEIGLPRLAKNLDWFDTFAASCAPYGVRMHVAEDGIIDCEWS